MTIVDPSVNRDNEVPKTTPDESRGEAKAEKERQSETVSEPGKFKNDPEDPTNPNEEIERHRRKLRP